MYSELFENDICQKLNQPEIGDLNTKHIAIGKRICSVFWISTHYRIRAVYDDENTELVKDYNLGMRKFFDDNIRCKGVNYIDVYNMTSNLALNHHDDSLQMTYDQVHWGYEVNLIKAQIILNAILSIDDNDR